MPNYIKIWEGEPRDLVDEALRRWARDLRGEDVTIGLLWATSSGASLYPLKIRGYPCLAIVRITSLRNRALGVPDATIEIDKWRWDNLTPEKRLALLHHEIRHLKLLRERRSGRVKYDAAGRPRLAIEPHDFEVGGFWSVIEAHGDDAIEKIQLQRALEGDKQAVFQFVGDENNEDDEDGDGVDDAGEAGAGDGSAVEEPEAAAV